jgi:SAM-dependent methyltransferase
MSEVKYEGGELEALADTPNYYAWIMDKFSDFVTGHVIEYGAGAGTISERLIPLVERLTLVEPSTNLVPKLRARFADHPKVKIIGSTLEAHIVELRANVVDAVVMINVLEHIQDDQKALSQLVHILKPGGHLLIFVPALQMLMSKFDVLHGHFRRYHRSDLAAKVISAGAVIKVCRYFDLVGVLPWLLLNRWGGCTTFNPWLVQINDKAVVPISKIIERIPPPFGKNLILVASKP